ncbi:Protein of unknown function [Thiothrix eikelboomii]|uniref:DUF3050 domain-containing protein n=1 Tax=Thiothrix eikelboomii TaxID=92487 RepID=A0A1T4VZC1_9GAMM|nr:DUF3050 domain-containing protein [Thiothrix eikelboomii]SKA69811.1 Protein of unknown function [Thiothrix eikelboomii]
MRQVITQATLDEFAAQLADHPIYSALTSLDDLQCFMEHHIYSVWDFMSLIKYLQAAVAPTTVPWLPQGDSSIRRFINELVLEEESDQLPDGNYSSHVELYLRAMTEVGANTQPFRHFLATVELTGVDTALELATVPAPSRVFSQQTFAFLSSQQAHQVAAALALGREHIIPMMFRSLLAKMQVSEKDAPSFHFYLNRHVHLDEDFHAPLSLRLLDSLCAGDAVKTQQAIQAAQQAVQARLQFWDGVLAALKS